MFMSMFVELDIDWIGWLLSVSVWVCVFIVHKFISLTIFNSVKFTKILEAIYRGY